MNIFKLVCSIFVIAVSTHAGAQAQLCLNASGPSATKPQLCPAIRSICVDNYVRGEATGNLNIQLLDGSSRNTFEYQETFQNNISDVASEVGVAFYDKTTSSLIDLMYQSDNFYPQPSITGNFSELRLLGRQGTEISYCIYDLFE